MKPFPDFLSIDSQGQITVNPKFVEFNEIKNWSIERQVETFWKQIREHIFEWSWLSEERIEKSLQAFTTAYELAKYKFQDIDRNLWGRYFDHWVRVMQYLIQSTKEPSIRKVLMAILHDILEDTNKTFWGLKEDYWVEIALGTLLISKRTIRDFLSSEWYVPLNNEQESILLSSNVVNQKWNYLSSEYLQKRFLNPENITLEEKNIEQLWIQSKNDFELLHIVDDTWVLNSKWLISDEVFHLKKYNPEKITPEQWFALELFQKISHKYKERRNKEYFSHMLPIEKNYEHIIAPNTPALNRFFNQALSITSHPNLRIRLSIEEIKEVALCAIEVKFWDRIDNLRTTEAYKYPTEHNIAKAKRKLQETGDYFFAIAYEFDGLKWTDFYSLLWFEVEKLKLFLKESVHLQTNLQVQKILKK